MYSAGIDFKRQNLTSVGVQIQLQVSLAKLQS